MFKELFAKLNTLEHEHQALFALVVITAVVLFSWGVEKIVEEYIFPGRPLVGYILAIVFGIMLIWLTQYVVLELV